MNIDHLKYVLEVEKCGSISKAAKNLYLNQPYLSKVISEVENELNIKIFERSNKGIETTYEGREALSRMTHIVNEMNALEHLYDSDQATFRFSVAVPIATYISHAFDNFIQTCMPAKSAADIIYHETNSSETIDLISEAECNLGIIRTFDFDKDYYRHLLEFKNLSSYTLCDFDCVVLMSKYSPLAGKAFIQKGDFKGMTALRHGDARLPRHTTSYLDDIYKSAGVNHSIRVFERASEFELLNALHKAFMFVSPMPDEILKRYDLITKHTSPTLLKAQDIVVYRKGYTLSREDTQFIEYLRNEIRQF